MTNSEPPIRVPQITPEALLHVESVRAALRDGRLPYKQFVEALLSDGRSNAESVEAWSVVAQAWATGPIEHVQGSHRLSLNTAALLTTVPGFTDRVNAYAYRP